MIWPPPKVQKEDTLAICTSSFVQQRHCLCFLANLGPISRLLPERNDSETEASRLLRRPCPHIRFSRGQDRGSRIRGGPDRHDRVVLPEGGGGRGGCAGRCPGYG